MKPGVLLCILSAAAAQAAPDGAAIFKTKCATCYVVNVDSVPSSEALSRKSRASVLTSLESGRMRIQGDSLTNAERRAVAAFLVPKDTETANPSGANRCAAVKPIAADLSGWNGWGVDLVNSRYQPRTSLNAENVSKLKLKVAFGIPNA